MKQDELIFEDDFLFHVFSQWKRPQLMLFQSHCLLMFSSHYFMN